MISVYFVGKDGTKILNNDRNCLSSDETVFIESKFQHDAFADSSIKVNVWSLKTFLRCYCSKPEEIHV